MQLNQTLITIRPRSIMDRLDLAFMLCGRHPIGLGLAMAVGIIPFVLLNHFIWTSAEEDSVVGLTIFLLPAELSLSTVFVTLYLGQMTFLQSFSLKQACWILFRQAPSLFVYQVLLKTVLCLTIILSPVAFISMYFMNEILLLERPSLWTAWKRRRYLHDQQIGELLTSRMAEFLILIVGGFIVSTLLFSLRDLWTEQSNYTPLEYVDGTMFENEYHLFNWPISVSLFVMISFLRVYRFTTYLDTRIRHEGWDVELKLRSLGQHYS